MNEAVAARYRDLTKSGFPNAGSLENPTVFINARAEGVSICGNAASDYINIYLKLNEDVIEDIRYLCNCDPTSNVVVETLCHLARGKTLKEAKALTKEQFYEAIGTDAGSVSRKVWASIELLNRVIVRHEVGPVSAVEPTDEDY